MNQTINSQLISWLQDTGVKALRIVKVTNRAVTYVLLNGCKGCCFAPKHLMKRQPLARRGHIAMLQPTNPIAQLFGNCAVMISEISGNVCSVESMLTCRSKSMLDNDKRDRMVSQCYVSQLDIWN